MKRTASGLIVLSAGLLAVGGRSGTAGTAVPELRTGPQIGNVTYRAEIRTTAEGEDEDTYSGRLARGERLTIKVVSPFQSGLYPAVELLGPDGLPRDVPLRSTRLGKVLEIRSFEVPETGRWTFRIAPILRTYGRYLVKFALRRAPPATVKVRADAVGQDEVVELRVDALEGARLDLRASGKKRTPEVGAVLDPSGQDVPGADGPAAGDVSVRHGVVSLKIPAIASGDGAYSAHVRLPAGHRGATLSVRTKAPERPRGSRKLSADEPWIEPRVSAIRGAEGATIRIRGRYLPYAPPPRVLFGEVPGTDVVVDPTETFLDVAAPALPEDALYDVTVVLKDGQSYSRPDYYYAVPTPRITDLLALDGTQVRAFGTGGGRTVQMIGSGYQTGMFIRVGASEDVLPQIRADGRAEFKLPAQPAGPQELRILDTYLHETVAPFLLEYKDPPVIDAAPFNPGSVFALAETAVFLKGSGFEPTDEVLFDGHPVQTIFWNTGFLQFVTPATPPGAYPVTVRDRVGSETVAVDLIVK